MKHTDAEAILKSHPGLLAKAEIAIFGLIMDRSGSMERYDDVPRTAINEHITKLKAHPQADSAIGFVLTFADSSKFEIEPQWLKGMPSMPEYLPEGNTRLYATVLEAIRSMLSLKAEAEKSGVRANMILTVFTDGDDNRSTECREELVRLSGEALEAGIELILVGIGYPAKHIAQKMGFPPQSAIQIAGSKEAVRNTMVGVTHRTHITMMGCSAPPTPIPPSSH